MKKSSYVTGIIGAILGAIICSLPWILTSVYLNIMIGYLGLIIGIGALKGYQLLNGKPTKKLPVIIISISIIVALFNSFVTIPMIQMSNEGIVASFNNLKYVYSLEGFLSDTIVNSLVTILFVVLGNIGLIASVKKQVSQGVDANDIEYNVSELNKKEKQAIVDYFVEHEATDAEKAIPIGYELDFNSVIVEQFKNQGILEQVDDKFFLNVEKCKAQIQKEKKAKQKNKKILIVSIVVVIVMFALVGLASLISDDENETDIYENDFISFEISNDYQVYEEDGEWTVVAKNDLEGNNGYIFISVYDFENDDIIDAIGEINSYYRNLEDVESVKGEIYKTDNGYDAVRNNLVLSEYYDQIEDIIVNNLDVTVEGVYFEVNSPISETVKEIANSVKIK